MDRTHSHAVLATAGGKPLAEFLLADAVRADARAAIEQLKLAGLKVAMLSGDQAGVVE
nr:HAD family hydrolase [Anaerolineae bacterium]